MSKKHKVTKEEIFERNLRKLIKEDSHLLAAIGIFSALALGMGSVVPGMLGLLMTGALLAWTIILLAVFLFKLVDTELGIYFKAYLGITLNFVVGGLTLHILFMFGRYTNNLSFYSVFAAVILLWLIALFIIVFSLRNQWIRNIQNLFGMVALVGIVLLSIFISYGIYITHDATLERYMDLHYVK